MKVKVKRGFCVEAGRDVFPGQVIDLPTAKALVEIHKGRVEAMEEGCERTVENRDPKVKRD